MKGEKYVLRFHWVECLETKSNAVLMFTRPVYG